MIKTTMKKVINYIIIQVILSLFLTLLLGAFPYLHKIFIDDILIGKNQDILVAVSVIYLALILLYLVFVFFSEKYLWKTSIKFENELKGLVFNRLLITDYTDFAKKKSEEYLSVLTKNITQIEQDYLTPQVSLIKSAISIAIYGAIIIYFNPYLFIVIIALSLVSIFIPNIFKKRLRKNASTYLKQNERYSVSVNELLKSFELIDSKVKVSYENKFNDETIHLSKLRLKYGITKIISNLFSGGSVMVLEYIVLLISIIFALNNLLTIGSVVMFFSYSKVFTDPITEILYCINAINSTEKIRADLEELNQTQVPKPIKNELDSTINYDNITLTLGDKNFNYNFELHTGKKYLIHGESGSGKSTLLKLIADKIGYDGDVTPLSSDLFTYISQDQIIFSDNFLNNVTTFNAFEYKNEMQLLGSIKQELKKYDNQQDLSIMSGGERQLIRVIRGITQNKEILIIDEPTTGMDNSLSAKIIHILEQLPQTVIVVSHELKLFDKSNWEMVNIENIRRVYA